MQNLRNKKYFEAKKNKKGDNIYLTNARSYQKTNKYSVWGLDLSFTQKQITMFELQYIGSFLYFLLTNLINLSPSSCSI